MGKLSEWKVFLIILGVFLLLSILYSSFVTQKKVVDEFYSPVDEGSEATAPIILQKEYVSYYDVTYWAKNFEIINFSLDSKSMNYRMNYKLKDGSQRNIYVETPQIELLFKSDVICQSNRACGNMTWLVTYNFKTPSGEIFKTNRIYCPLEIKECIDLKARYE